MFAAELEYCLDNNFRSHSDPLQHFIFARTLRVAGTYRAVSFSAVKDNRKISSIHDLVNHRYAWRGYGSNHRIPCDDYHTSFAAEVDDAVISTITLAVDSSHGLAIDQTFGDVADRFRRKAGTRICELTKLALEEGIGSKEVLAGLFHLAFIHGSSASDCTDLFIEVNPRHVRFYEAMLGFSRLGAPRTNASVEAPSQLMHLEVDAIGDQIRRLAGKAPAGRSLYPYFFSGDDERRIRLILALARSVQGHSPAAEKPVGEASVMQKAA